MWTDKERQIAKALNNEDTLAFLERIFVELLDSNEEKLKGNIVGLDDAEYGQLMKVLYLSKLKNKNRLALIKSIAASKKETKVVATAPK